MLAGTGVALCVERSGGLFEYAEVTRDGRRVVVAVGSIPTGQGHETLFAQIAADRLGVDPERVTVAHRRHRRDRARRRLVREPLDRDGRLGGRAGGRRPARGRRPGDARFESDQVFASGAYAAVVEVDRATGHVRVRRLVAVDDAGRIINPLLAEGQVIGGAVQGLGACLTEERPRRPAAADSLLDYAS